MLQWLRLWALNARAPSSFPDQGTRCRMLQLRPRAAKSINGYIYLNLKDTMLFFFFFLKVVFLHVNKNYGKCGGGGRVVLRLESTVFLNTVETLSWNHFTTLAWLCWLPNN